MDTINWNNQTPSSFTEFCNALLVSEVSKNVKVFSAPGKDGGIDASYIGKYAESEGSWRFQYKFHKVVRKQGFYSLKSELSSEIEKLNSEDFLVLMTNIELLPQEHQALEDVFELEKKKVSPISKLLVWDGAKLQSLLVSHPLVFYWLDEGFETAQLQDYHIYFNKAINSKQFAPNTLSNIFIGRESKLAELHEFLEKEKNLLLIQGEAGIGKTRLLIEFFKKLESEDSTWRTLVLAAKNISFDRLKKALSAQENYILMVDDAHGYDAKEISDLLRIANASGNRIKLILTVRSLETSSSLQHIREYDQEDILKMNLSTLERTETQAAFEPYIRRTSYWFHIGDLINITYGRPILIVAVLRAIQEHTRIETIRETDFLRNYVNNYFNEFHQEFQKLTGLSNIRSKRFLQHIALIEPFSFEDQTIINKLSEIHDIHYSEVTTAFNLLKTHSFVSGRFEHSIKPDYYSDIILQEISIKDASNYLFEFGAQLDNIVINLSSVNDSNRDKKVLLDDILDTYVNWIDHIEDGPEMTLEKKTSIIGRILNTIGRIVYVKPKIAQQAVDLYLKNLTKSEHPVQFEFADNINSPYQSTDTLINKVITILSRLFLIPEFFGYVYDASFRLFEKTTDKRMFTVYSFNKRDVFEHYKLDRQKYVIKQLRNEAKNITISRYSFATEILRAILNLEFTVTEASAINRDAISITTYTLPNSESVKELRAEISNLLIYFYSLPQLSNIKLETLKLILDVPRGIFATQKHGKSYENDSEISHVLKFLEEEGESFDLLEQKEALDKLFWFGKWGMDEKFNPQVARIEEKLKPKDLAERLSQLFGSSSVSMLRNPNIHEYIAEQCNQIANNFSEKELAIAMKKFLEPQPYSPHYFWEFLRHLEKGYTSHVLYFHDYLFESDSPLYYQYASGILSALRFEQNKQDDFWERVLKLQNQDTWQADNVILQAYGNRVLGTATIEDRDVELILKINNKFRKENNYALAGGLQSVISAGHQNVANILADFLDRAHQKEAEVFFIWLLDNRMASPELVRYLLLEKTVRFYLSYEIERGLLLVLKEYGISIVFNYLLRRYAHKKEEVIATRSLIGYEFVPPGEHSQLFEEQPEKRIEMFTLALNWYLETDSTGGHLYYGKDMLVYLQPGQSITPDIYSIYECLLTKSNLKIDLLGRIADSLSIFQQKDSSLVALVVKTYIISRHLKNEDSEIFNQIYFALHSALTSVGVKSGQPGLPFQVDLDLRELLIKEIEQLPHHDEARLLLKGVLGSVENDINRNYDLDNETW